MEETNQHVQRVAFYCRVSTEEQREGQTIESQIRELEKFAADKGWITTEVYKDDGWSGAILARPSLDRLRDDASRHRFDIVLLNGPNETNYLSSKYLTVNVSLQLNRPRVWTN